MSKRDYPASSSKSLAPRKQNVPSAKMSGFSEGTVFPVRRNGQLLEGGVTSAKERGMTSSIPNLPVGMSRHEGRCICHRPSSLPPPLMIQDFSDSNSSLSFGRKVDLLVARSLAQISVYS